MKKKLSQKLLRRFPQISKLEMEELGNSFGIKVGNEKELNCALSCLQNWILNDQIQTELLNELTDEIKNELLDDQA